ncbi:hypothetical protein LINPERHAP1_LOCUS15535 [Linum perenne]
MIVGFIGSPGQD